MMLMSECEEHETCVVAYSNYTFQGSPSTDLLLLAESVRAFGGRARDWPLWILCDDLSRLSSATLRRAASLRVALLPFNIDPAIISYPFAAKASAAAAAERLAEGHFDQLLWFDRDSLALRDLSPLRLKPDKKMSYRPVNVKNIGLVAEEPISSDPFWARAFGLSGVDETSAGTVTSYVDLRVIRFYIAAGLVGARPPLGLFQSWERLFRSFASDAVLSAFCAESPLHSIFLHQAALSLAAAQKTAVDERQELPYLSMYPLNFWEKDSAERRPSLLDEAVSLRYDTELDNDSWRRFPMRAELERWISAHIHVQA